MSSYVAPMTEDPTDLHAEPEHHISASDRLEVNLDLVLCSFGFPRFGPCC